MKQFIVMLAVVPILMFFIMQLTLDQVNNSRIALINDIVYAAKEEAKQQGGFNESALRAELAAKTGVPAEEIYLELSPSGSVPRIDSKGNRGLIYYKVVVPIDEIIIGSNKAGLSRKRLYGYKLESSAPSEYLP